MITIHLNSYNSRNIIKAARKYCIKTFGETPVRFCRPISRNVYDVDNCSWYNRVESTSSKFIFNDNHHDFALLFILKFGEHVVKVKET